ncbi:MAG: paraquat-inducible protein A [Burkholderiales bacterium]|nr:paraquat-inducible protein A [Burkholderiales bacterium]
MRDGETIACGECDLLLRGAALAPGTRARCPRCGALLARAPASGVDRPLALALASLVTLAVAHLNPVFGIEVQGQILSTSLWGAAAILYREGAWFLSALVLATTLLFPALQLLAICDALLARRAGHNASTRLLRLLHAVEPWVMVEVFMLGVLIAVVKLSSLAGVLPGAGLVAFAAAMLLMAATSASFDAHRALLASSQVLPPPPTSPLS